jgi:ATP-dependent RNA helicase DDX19/DBP5
MLSRIDPNLNYPQAICLAPSRELSRQLLTSVQNMSKFTTITSVAVVKDAFKKREGEADYLAPNKPLQYHIIIGTPGIIMDCLRRYRVIDTSKLKLFVLDEADNMLDQAGLGDQSIRIKK